METASLLVRLDVTGHNGNILASLPIGLGFSGSMSGLPQLRVRAWRTGGQVYESTARESMEIVMIRRESSLWPRGAALTLAVLLISGCAGMADIRGSRGFMEEYSQGYYLEAARTLGGENALDYEENLLTSLNVGMALRAGSRYEASQIAFDRAESGLLWKSDEITNLDQLLSAGFTLVTNDLARPYQGNIYDGVLINTFKAMNAVYLGDVNRARVELNRADQRQANAVEQLAVKVRALGEEDPEEKKNREAQTEQIDSALGEVWKPDGPVAKRLSAAEALGEYRDLRNPFTDWLHGVFRIATGDANRASNLFRDAAVLDGRNNRYVLADLLLAEEAASGSAGAPDRVWIVHEDGTGPALEEFRFDFPVATSDGVIVAGIALPEFVTGVPAVDTLVVNADGQDYRTELLLDVDRYAATEFRAGYSAVVAKAVAAAVIRTILQAVVQKEADEAGGLLGSITTLVSTVGAVALNRADTRIWHSLPKTIDVASLPRPSDGKLLIAASGGQTIYDDTLPEGRFVLITVKTVRQGMLPAVHVSAFGE